MKPEPGKKNFSLLWILGGVAVAAGAALLFARSKRPIGDEEYVAKEKELFEQLPHFIARLRSELPMLKGERQQEVQRLLYTYERKLRVIEEALRSFPDDVEKRKAYYEAERALLELEQRLSE